MDKRKRKWHRIICFFLGCALTGAVLAGCGREYTSRTIILPEDDGGKEGIEVKDIKEYTYESASNVIGYLTWDQEEAGTFRILTSGESGEYVYYEEKIRIEDQQNLEKELLDDRKTVLAGLAPGGKYISYEVREGGVVSLIVYYTADREWKTLRNWDGEKEDYQYAWSDDGSRLFMWQNGEVYGENGYRDWEICRYDMETDEKSEVSVSGIGRSYRQVLPNRDGTCVYIVEDSMEEGNLYADVHKFRHRVADMESGEVTDLGDWNADEAYPIKYTDEGMYAYDLDGRVFLYTDLLTEPVRNELFKIDYTSVELCMCENQDHIFLVEWDANSRYMQVSAVKLENGRVAGRQVLYKGISGTNAKAVISPRDDAIAIQSSEYIEDDTWRIKITVLEY